MLSFALACGPISLGGGADDDAPVADAPIGTYEMGWPIDACSTDFPDEGTGHAEGDVLPQYSLLAQTGERVNFHDFCNQVVYIEFGFFT